MNFIRRVFGIQQKSKTKLSPIELLDEDIRRRQLILKQKSEKAIKEMGDKWILHPNHHVKNKNVDKNTLGFKSV